MRMVPAYQVKLSARKMTRNLPTVDAVNPRDLDRHTGNNDIAKSTCQEFKKSAKTDHSLVNKNRDGQIYLGTQDTYAEPHRKGQKK